MIRSMQRDVARLVRRHGTRDPRRLLEERGVQLLPMPRATHVLGMYTVLLRNRFVFYNANLDDAILRMVFAHELGHDCYHRRQAAQDLPPDLSLTGARSRLETEANCFAAYLLIEEDELFEGIRERETIGELAARFRVDESLIIYRLRELQKEQRPDVPLFLTEEAEPNFFRAIDGRNPLYWAPENRD